MNVIANNCCGGWFYRCHKHQFNNPFIWMVAPYDSIYNAMMHFYDINWANIKLRESTLRRNTFIINVDNLIDIHYVHYIFSPDYTELTTLPHKLYPEYDGNVVSNNIWEYVIDTYLKRTRRMMSVKEPPVFLIRDEKFAAETTKQQITDLANCQSKYKRVIITTNKDVNRNDAICKTIHVDSIEYPRPTVEKYYTQLNDFYGL